jgi:sugar lactone lactonase YvrE
MEGEPYAGTITAKNMNSAAVDMRFAIPLENNGSRANLTSSCGVKWGAGMVEESRAAGLSARRPLPPTLKGIFGYLQTRESLHSKMGFYLVVIILVLLEFCAVHSRPSGTILQPLPKGFDPGNASIVYIRNRLNILPQGFEHTKEGKILYGNLLMLDQPFFDIDTPDSHIQKDLKTIANSQFIAFDKKFFDIIGPQPSLERMFNLSESLREAPVYIESENLLFINDIGAQRLMRINLTDTPLFFEFVESDHIQTIGGAAYSPKTGLIYATVNPSKGPSEDSKANTLPRNNILPGIYSIDPITLKADVLVNNYLGHHFNSPNDLVIDNDGAIWFTDPPYAAILGNGTPAELRPNVFFFNPTTHTLRIVEEDLQLPNGIALDQAGKILYVADSGALCQPIGQPTLPSEHRSIYAYDVVGPGQIRNRRLLHSVDLWVPDGIKVSVSGVVYAAAGVFVDVISPNGDLLGKINTGGLVMNLVFAGPDLRELWAVGVGGVYRVHIADSGIPLQRKSSLWNVQT